MFKNKTAAGLSFLYDNLMFMNFWLSLDGKHPPGAAHFKECKQNSTSVFTCEATFK